MGRFFQRILSPKALFGYALAGGYTTYEILAEGQEGWLTVGSIPRVWLWAILIFFAVMAIVSLAYQIAPTVQKLAGRRPMAAVIGVGALAGAIFGAALAALIWWVQALNHPPEPTVSLEEKTVLFDSIERIESGINKLTGLVDELRRAQIAKQRLAQVRKLLDEKEYLHKSEVFSDEAILDTQQSSLDEALAIGVWLPWLDTTDYEGLLNEMLGSERIRSNDNSPEARIKRFRVRLTNTHAYLKKLERDLQALSKIRDNANGDR